MRNFLWKNVADSHSYEPLLKQPAKCNAKDAHTRTRPELVKLSFRGKVPQHSAQNVSENHVWCSTTSTIKVGYLERYQKFIRNCWCNKGWLVIHGCWFCAVIWAARILKQRFLSTKICRFENASCASVSRWMNDSYKFLVIFSQPLGQCPTWSFQCILSFIIVLFFRLLDRMATERITNTGEVLLKFNWNKFAVFENLILAVAWQIEQIHSVTSNFLHWCRFELFSSRLSYHARQIYNAAPGVSTHLIARKCILRKLLNQSFGIVM
jgi:hypothetical protein